MILQINATLRTGPYGPEEEDASAVLIYGNEKARPTLSRAEAVMYTTLQGKQLTYSTWLAAGMGGEAKVLGRTAAQGAIRKLLASGRVVKTGKLYSQAASEEQEWDDSDPE